MPYIKRDLAHNVTEQVSVAPISLNAVATTNGTGVNRGLSGGFEAVMFLILTGLYTGAGAALTVQVQDSPDNAVWTLVPDAQITAASGLNSVGFGVLQSSFLKLGYLGAQQYVRVTLAVAGTTPTVLVSAAGILGGGRTLAQLS